MMEMQFSDFVTVGFNQIVNNLAKIHWRWGQQADVVVRMPTGGNVGAGPFHSQSTEAWFFHVPGLKVVYPSTPADAKGLLLRSLKIRTQCCFLNTSTSTVHSAALFERSHMPSNWGKRARCSPSTDATIITYGLGVQWAEAAAAASGASIEIIDLRTLLPWDEKPPYSKACGRPTAPSSSTRTP